MPTNHNRRQRKKLRLGEFKEFGFEVSAQLAEPLSFEQRDQLLDTFIETCVEANEMAFGGGINEVLSGYIASAKRRGSLTQTHRDIVDRWLRERSELHSVRIGELNDAWHGH